MQASVTMGVEGGGGQNHISGILSLEYYSDEIK